MPQLKSVRRDAERGGRDARAPQTTAFRRFHIKYVMWKEVAGEGADHHTRGRACSPESFASAFGEDLGRWAVS
jgi:hypothetical protein